MSKVRGLNRFGIPGHPGARDKSKLFYAGHRLSFENGHPCVFGDNCNTHLDRLQTSEKASEDRTRDDFFQ